METGSHELAILSYATVCLHPSVSLNNEKICREFSEHKIAVCEKTAGLRSGNSSDLNSACLKVLVPVEIFQFSAMHYETERYRDSTDGLGALRDIIVNGIKRNPELSSYHTLVIPILCAGEFETTFIVK